MASGTIKVPQSRGSNQVDGKMTDKIVSNCGNRSATARYCKMSVGQGRWEPVESWTLRERVGGKMRVVCSGRSKEQAEMFVFGGHEQDGE